MSYNVLPDIFLHYKVVQRVKNYCKFHKVFLFKFCFAYYVLINYWGMGVWCAKTYIAIVLFVC